MNLVLQIVFCCNILIVNLRGLFAENNDHIIQSVRYASTASRVISQSIINPIADKELNDAILYSNQAQILLEKLNNRNETSTTMLMAQESAQNAVAASLKAVELINKALMLVQLVKEQTLLAAAKSSESVALYAANKAISSHQQNIQEQNTIKWASADGIDKWLIEEIYQNIKEEKGDNDHVSWFIDIGANDGVSRSQTYTLESSFQWRGICIEANDISFKALSLGRPNCINVHACVASKGGLKESFAVDHSILIDDTTGEVYSGMYSGILETNIGERVGWNSEQAPLQICFTRTLHEILLSSNAPSFIEFLSIDCEGCEFGILSTFPFEQYRFGVLILEHNGDGIQRSNIRSVLELNGYIRYLASFPDDTYILAPHLWPEVGYIKGKNLASKVNPYINLNARQYLTRNHDFNHLNRENEWICPLSLSDVLISNGVSWACPLPSAHNGYERYLENDIFTVLPRTISSINYNVDNEYNFFPRINSDIVEDVHDELSGGVAAFMKKKLGASETMVRSILHYLRISTQGELSQRFAKRSHPSSRDAAGQSKTSLNHENHHDIGDNNNLYVRTSVSILPGLIATIEPLRSDNNPTNPDYIVFTNSLNNKNIASDMNNDVNSLNMEEIFQIYKKMMSFCHYIGNKNQERCDQISALLSNHSVPMFLKGLKQEPIPSQLNANDDDDDAITSEYYKLLHLQFYVESCFMNLRHNKTGSTHWVPWYDPEVSCVSLAWRLKLDVPLDLKTSPPSSSVLLEPVMAEIDRGTMSDQSRMLLNRVALFSLL